MLLLTYKPSDPLCSLQLSDQLDYCSVISYIDTFRIANMSTTCILSIKSHVSFWSNRPGYPEKEKQLDGGDTRRIYQNCAQSVTQGQAFAVLTSWMRKPNTHRATSTCTYARRTYAAGYRRRIRGEQRIYPVRGVPGARGGAADPRPPPRGCPLCWSSSWPAWSPPGGRALSCCHPLPGRHPWAPPARLTSPLLRAGRSSSSFWGTRPRRWRRPVHPPQRRRRPPGCWAWSSEWRRWALLLRAGGETKQVKC